MVCRRSKAKTIHMSTEEKNTGSKRTTPVVLALIALGALGSTTYLLKHQAELEALVTDERSGRERAQAGQQMMEARLLETGQLLETARQEGVTAKEAIASLESRLQETLDRAGALEREAGRNASAKRELADLRSAAQQLRDELDRTRANENELRASVDRANADRDALAAKLEQRDAAALMVNNAGLDAVKGRKGKLTVVARRTKEVRMAFDLPQAMAGSARYRIIAPNGKEYNGAEPVISKAEFPADATASVGGVARPGAAIRSSRVNLKFQAKEKLKPGAYRVEVLSDRDHLQTLQLNLR